jgi:hypothetical protein
MLWLPVAEVERYKVFDLLSEFRRGGFFDGKIPAISVRRIERGGAKGGPPGLSINKEIQSVFDGRIFILMKEGSTYVKSPEEKKKARQ